MTAFIQASLDQVEAFIEQQHEKEDPKRPLRALYGRCGEPGLCLVAKVSRSLNPDFRQIEVYPHFPLVGNAAHVDYVTPEGVYGHEPLQPHLNYLASAFDKLLSRAGDYHPDDYAPTHEEVLALLSEARQFCAALTLDC